MKIEIRIQDRTLTAADPVFLTASCLIRVYETLSKGFITPRSVVQVHSPLPDNISSVGKRHSIDASFRLCSSIFSFQSFPSNMVSCGSMDKQPDYEAMLQVAIDESRIGLSQGRIPSGGA